MAKDKSILVIDNDKVQSKIIESALRPQGYVPIHAKNGREALKILETNRPGLLLIDMGVQGFKGFKTLKKIRNVPKFADIPVIILTVYDKLEFKIKAMDFGADDLITKPFDLKELVSRVNALFGGQARKTEAGGSTVSGEDRLKRYGELPKAGFAIVKSEKCPMYEYGDKFELSGLSFKTPGDKTTCISLLRNIEDFVRFGGGNIVRENGSAGMVRCGGCTGSITLEYAEIAETETSGGENAEKIRNTVLFLSKVPIFQWFDRETIKELALSMSLKKYKAGKVLIEVGESARFLYTIVSGSVEVLDDSGTRIATLRTGDVVGEISLISGDPLEARISVASTSVILKVDGYYFRKVLNKNPAIQLYLSKLFARRPAKPDETPGDEQGVEKLTVILPPVLKHCSMMGKLSDMVPSILLQMLNMNQQTGVLSLELSGGKASICFRGGEIIEAEYGRKNKTDAFYEIMKQKEGRFKFVPGIPAGKTETPILGGFMGLLMEGVRQVDEQ